MLVGHLARTINEQNKNILFLQNVTLALLKKGIITDNDIKEAIAESDQKFAARSAVQSSGSGQPDGSSNGSSGVESSLPVQPSNPANPGSPGGGNQGSSSGEADESNKPLSSG